MPTYIDVEIGPALRLLGEAARIIVEQHDLIPDYVPERRRLGKRARRLFNELRTLRLIVRSEGKE